MFGWYGRRSTSSLHSASPDSRSKTPAGGDSHNWNRFAADLGRIDSNAAAIHFDGVFLPRKTLAFRDRIALSAYHISFSRPEGFEAAISFRTHAARVYRC